MVQGLRDQKVKQNCNCNIGSKRTLLSSTGKDFTVTEINRTVKLIKVLFFYLNICLARCNVGKSCSFTCIHIHVP